MWPLNCTITFLAVVANTVLHSLPLLRHLIVMRSKSDTAAIKLICLMARVFLSFLTSSVLAAKFFSTVCAFFSSFHYHKRSSERQFRAELYSLTCSAKAVLVPGPTLLFRFVCLRHCVGLQTSAPLLGRCTGSETSASDTSQPRCWTAFGLGALLPFANEEHSCWQEARLH